MSTSTIQIGKNIIGIGRDFQGNIINNNPEELFSKINVSGFSKDYLPPKIAAQMLANLKKDRLLVVGGDYGFDKGSLLRYLSDQLAVSTQSEVFEWIGTTERQSLFSALGRCQPGIFILQQLQPHHINYDLPALEKIAQRQQLSILISTDTPKKAWQFTSASQQHYWINLDAKNTNYDPKLIEKELARLLNQYIGSIHFSNGLNKVDVNSDLPGGSLKQLAANLTSPEQVHFFVKQLASRKGVIDLTVLKECLQQTLNKQDTLMHKWFHSLEPLEQYIALSMVLFSDLFDDQYFGTAKMLAESEWKYSHNGLKALDYKDIEKLFNFFRYDVVSREQRYIRNKFPNQRIELFKSSWYSHRRHIKMALNVSVRLVVEAADNSHMNTELYGGRQKRNTLRQSITHLLSDLGRLSRNLIEEPLMILASQDSLASQNVAAGAIANWREIPGGDQQLFDILSDWQESSQWNLIIDELIKGREKASSPAAYLRSAIVLTIGKATNYDAPNQLSTKLIELLFSFLNDTHSLVRNRLIQTIPDIIRHHASQFSKSVQLGNKKAVPLETLLKHEDLIYPVAVGLALSFQDSTGSTGKIIASCLQHCKNKVAESAKKDLSKRDKLMAAMTLAIGKIIEWNDLNVLVDGRTAYEIFKSLREQEKNLILRSLLLHIIVEQIILSHSNWKLIQILIPKLSAGERDQIIYLIGQHYLEERKKLDDGEKRIKIEDAFYDIWIYKDRPFLPIENLMFDWLKEDSKQLQQLATMAFIEFSALLEYEEERIRKEILEQEEKEASSTQNEGFLEVFKPALIKGRFSLITFFYKLFIKATISKGAAKILDAALPVMSRAYLFNRAYKKVVIEKWKKVSGDIKEAAKSLAKLTR